MYNPSQPISQIIIYVLVCGVVLLSLCRPTFAQELETRRWSHLPIDRNFLAGGYAHTDGEINFDPALRIEDAVVELNTWSLSYVRTFELLDKSARIEVRQAWQTGTWSGLVNGKSASVDRQGLADTITRFAVNFVGAPPQEGRAYAEYRAATNNETIIGAALNVHLPTGEYMEDKLINLGGNRFIFRPQLGFVHNHNEWSFEVTGAVWIYTDNDELLIDKRLEQDPFYTVQTHLIYTMPEGHWVSVSAGAGAGGETEVNGIGNDDRKEDIVWAIAGGFPITRSLAFKATYIDSHRRNAAGNESQTIAFTLQTSF